MGVLDRVKNLKENECIIDVLYKETCGHKCIDCGKCVFGYEGIAQLEMIMKDITEKKGSSSDLDLLSELSGMMKQQSLCEDGEEIASAVLAALATYREDFEQHIAKKACRAGVCQKFMTYHILAEQCTGCGECMDACEDDAILGKKRFVHVIDQKECIQCGKCLEACEDDAIVRAGAEKPRCPKKPIPCKKR